jgi:hypothetical protein
VCSFLLFFVASDGWYVVCSEPSYLGALAADAAGELEREERGERREERGERREERGERREERGERREEREKKSEVYQDRRGVEKRKKKWRKRERESDDAARALPRKIKPRRTHLDVLGHDGHALGVDGAEVGVLEEAHEVRLGVAAQVDPF